MVTCELKKQDPPITENWEWCVCKENTRHVHISLMECRRIWWSGLAIFRSNVNATRNHERIQVMLVRTELTWIWEMICKWEQIQTQQWANTGDSRSSWWKNFLEVATYSRKRTIRMNEILIYNDRTMKYQDYDMKLRWDIEIRVERKWKIAVRRCNLILETSFTYVIQVSLL